MILCSRVHLDFRAEMIISSPSVSVSVFVFTCFGTFSADFSRAGELTELVVVESVGVTQRC